MDEDVKNYGLMSQSKKTYIAPKKRNIRDNQIIIVTRGGATILKTLRIRGIFTHIFIDEAAQGNSSSAWDPFSLANEKTCIVLAGDHKKIVQKEYSAGEEKREICYSSVVGRLIDPEYRKDCQLSNSLPKVILSINYRTHPDITRFIARGFYGSSDKLISETYNRSSVMLPPMSTYITPGQEVLDLISGSYFNMAEVQEIVARVAALYENWPAAWGVRNPAEILVTAPYSEQVKCLQSALRCRSHDLGQVIVLKVQDIPGLEFRAVFLSTVRTRRVDANHTKQMDMGFFSEIDLLHLAFTRAKSFIAVAGDAVALCTVGRCNKIWTEYVRGSQIYPEGLETIYDIKRLRREGETAQFSRVKYGPIKPPCSLNKPKADLKLKDEPQAANSRATTNKDDKPFCVPVELNETLSLLAAVSCRIQQLFELRDSNLSSAENQYICLPEFSDVNEEDVHRSNQTTHVEEKNNFNINALDSGCIYSTEHLKELIKTFPDRYMRCTLIMDTLDNLHGKPLEPQSQYDTIKLANRSRCGHGFHGDEVVIEILDKVLDETEQECEGQVVGVLNHRVNPRYCRIICRVDDHNCGLMIPVDAMLPKIMNYRQKDQNLEKPFGKVPVYSFGIDERVVFQRYEDATRSNSKLFEVIYLRWKPSCVYPLGVVVNVIDVGSALAAMLNKPTVYFENVIQ